MSETATLDRLDECIRLAFEDPDIYIREMLRPHVLYVMWKRAAILQGGCDAKESIEGPATKGL